MQVSVTSSTGITLAEIFPINISALPPLTAYQVTIRHGEFSIIGGKLSFRLQKAFSGHWVWSNPWIVTDTPKPDQDIAHIIEQVWREEADTFRGLLHVRQLSSWRPTAQVYADFAARSLWPELRSAYTHLLDQWSSSFGTIRISRSCDVRGWVVQQEPALSISIDSRLMTNQTVQAYLNREASPDTIMDLLVADRESTLKGTITGITGSVKEHRGRLLSLVGSSPSKVHIQAAADDEAVVNVYAANRTTYEYVARGLQIVVRTADYTRFRVNGQQVTAQLRLSPQKRSQMIGQLAQLAKEKGFIGEAYSSSRQAHLFFNRAEVQFAPSLSIGNKQRVTEMKDRAIQTSLQRYGFYKRITSDEGTALSIGVLNALPHIAPEQFLTALQNELRRFKFSSHIAAIQAAPSLSRHELATGVRSLQESGANILLALFPDDVAPNLNEMQWGAYDHFKSLTIGNDIPSQVVHQTTTHNSYALGNIALGMLSKVGNVPYVLSTPLPYADIVVGIDIARRRKTRLTGSLNATAIARIYQNTGEFLQYVIHDAQLEGETIPADVLHSLFPPALFTGKRVVIHRDGLFRGDEKQALKIWAAQLNAQFHLVELLKTGTPRLYQFLPKTQLQAATVQQPLKGSAFRLNDHQAFLISSLPPFTNVTPYPLHVRTEAPFSIEEAVHSVLALTLLHYGSLRSPRLPVTIHYSDEIAYLALKGIKPKSLEGSLPFWL